MPHSGRKGPRAVFASGSPDRDCDAAQAVLSELTIFLGEAADADPAHSFGLVWAFVVAFDRAFVKVAKACFKDSALLEELEEANAHLKKARHRTGSAPALTDH